MPFDCAPDELSEDIRLLRAVRREVKKGWCTHTMEDEKGNVCLYGAAYRHWYGSATSLGGRDYEVMHQRNEHLAHLLDLGNSQNAVLWNNNWDRTQQDVLDRIDAALEKVTV